jgi:hypothetical protein
MTSLATSRQSKLRYQQQRALDDVPGYVAGLELCLSTGDRVYVALSATDLALYCESNLAIHYDWEGRLTKISEPNQYYRRSFSHRVLFTRKLPAEQGGGVAREVLPGESADAVVEQTHVLSATVAAELDNGAALIESAKPSHDQALKRIAPLLRRAARFDVAAARDSAEKFCEIYGRVAVLPPDQYNALVLQATEGCPYGQCLFCELYRAVPYRSKTPAQFRDHLRAAVAFHGEGLRARRSIFLGEANALVQSQPALIDILHILNEQFEFPPENRANATEAGWWLGSSTRFDGVSSFLDVFSRPDRAAVEYWELRRLGLRRVYIGMETGDDALSRWLRKPVTARALSRCVHALKEAKLAVGVIVLVGAGGRKFCESHVRETVRLLNALPLGLGDYIYFSPLTIYPGCQYAVHAIDDAVGCLTPSELRQQEQQIRAGLRFDPSRGRPYLARYELETFVY